MHLRRVFFGHGDVLRWISIAIRRAHADEEIGRRGDVNAVEKLPLQNRPLVAFGGAVQFDPMMSAVPVELDPVAVLEQEGSSLVGGGRRSRARPDSGDAGHQTWPAAARGQGEHHDSDEEILHSASSTGEPIRASPISTIDEAIA